jgi:hypothetical protein
MEISCCNLLFLGVQSWCIHVSFFGCLAGRVGGELEGNEMNKFFGKIKDESGQALVIVALSVVVLFGATAMSVDLGMAYNAKAELQAAADAAALAGAQDLPNATVAKQAAENYAGFNEVKVENVVAVTPYAGNTRQIEVTCTQEFEYFFAKILGFDSKVIVARAVAERRLVWGGETLPFMNIDDPYDNPADPTIVLWEKTQTGDYEQLLNRNNHPEYEFTYDGDKKNSSAINCMLNGLGDLAIDIRNGLNASIDSEVEELCTLWQANESGFIYILSLKTIPTDPLNYINANTIKEGGKVTGASIPLDEIVLLKCSITDFILSPVSANDRGIYLTVDQTFEEKTLQELFDTGEELPGFVNYDVRYRLVE